MKGLRAYILKANYGSCANGGISDYVEKVTVVGEEIEAVGGAIFEPNDDAPAVKLVRKQSGSYIAVPVDKPSEPMCGPMMGGSFINSTDSRFYGAIGGYYAIPLHDRYETAEQNRALSV